MGILLDPIPILVNTAIAAIITAIIFTLIVDKLCKKEGDQN